VPAIRCNSCGDVQCTALGADPSQSDVGTCSRGRSHHDSAPSRPDSDAKPGFELRADRTLSCGRRVMAAADDEGVVRARDGHAALSARESRALRKLLREAPTSNALSACSLRSSPSEISSRTLRASSFLRYFGTGKPFMQTTVRSASSGFACVKPSRRYRARRPSKPSSCYCPAAHSPCWRSVGVANRRATCRVPGRPTVPRRCLRKLLRPRSAGLRDRVLG
jgi:hypothetical protein